MNNIEYMEAYRYGRYDEQAEFISVIEDIKAEIQNGMEMFPDGDFYISVDVLEKIIDKHISGEPQESEEI